MSRGGNGYDGGKCEVEVTIDVTLKATVDVTVEETAKETPGSSPQAEMIIAVGSTNPAKVGAVSAVARRAFANARVVAVAVDSGVAAQPLSARETATGARNRAAAALAAVPGAALGIGLEGGLDPTPGGGDLVNCCAIASPDGRLSIAWGVRFPLPPPVVERLVGGEELGFVIDDVMGLTGGKGRLGAVGLLTGGLVTREALWEHAVACALIPHRHPALYPAETAGLLPRS